MAKKRLIFVLLYLDGQFCISRNFRLQKIGNTGWLSKNYNFSRVSRFIDELVILNVGQLAEGHAGFLDAAAKIAGEVFVPVALGGAIRTPEDAARYFDMGADKVVVNTLLWQSPGTVRKIADTYGVQAVVASVDYRLREGVRVPFLRGENPPQPNTLSDYLEHVSALGVGEVLLNSVDQDGTGFGLDLGVADAVPQGLTMPLVMMGGIGRTDHFLPGFRLERVSGVATANLFAFIGDGLASSRHALLESGMCMAAWD